MRSTDLKRVMEQYERFRPKKLLFTKLDETSSPGTILNEAVRTRKPVSLVTTGQRIPEDLEAGNQGSSSQLHPSGPISEEPCRRKWKAIWESSIDQEQELWCKRQAATAWNRLQLLKPVRRPRL